MSERVKGTLKVATFNVLKPMPWFEWVVQTKVRYNYQIHTLLPSLEADIICLNEVTESYARLLENDPYLTATYQYTPLRPPDTDPDDMRVVILSKTPFKVINPKGYVIVHLTEKNVLVVAAHLKAFESRMEIRNEQLSNIDNLLRKYSKESEYKGLASTIHKGNVVLLGDLNLHFVGETELLWNHGWTDLWLKKYFHEDGYTWDPNINSIIANYLFLDNRRMRLDRICMKASEEIRLRDIKIFANKIIPDTSVFPSDHFGLVAELDFLDGGFVSSDVQGANRMRGDYLLPPSRAINLKNTGYYGAPMPSQEKWTTGFRTMKQIIAYRVGAIVFLLVIATSLGWMIFYFALK